MRQRKLVRRLRQTIDVFQRGDGAYEIETRVDGHLKASYGSGDKAWAQRLATALAAHDDPRAACRTRWSS